MEKDEVWERLKKDETKVYGQSMLDMFLKTTDRLERRHLDELPEAKRRLVNPEVKLKLASTVGEAERAVKDGAKDFDTALLYAARGGHLDVCKRLVEKGARNFNTALYRAAEGGNLDVCRLFVEKGAKDFNTALHGAA